MFVRTTNGNIVKIKVADIEDVTFGMDVDLPIVPTTIDQAKEMLVGYWVWLAPIYDDFIEAYYFIITEDYQFKQCIKFKYSNTLEEYEGYEEYVQYAGKYIAGTGVDITFPSEDPTTFYCGEEWYEGTNLQLSVFYFNDGSIGNAIPCVRVEPFEYIELTMPDDDLMKK